MPSTASFSLMEWRHLFHWATDEWTYTLERGNPSLDFFSNTDPCARTCIYKRYFKLTIRSAPPATWWAERCSFSGPPLSSGPAPLRRGLNSFRLSTDRSPCSSHTRTVRGAACAFTTSDGEVCVPAPFCREQVKDKTPLKV